MQVVLLNESDVRGLIGPAQALSACREAFTKLARGEVEQPAVIGMDLTEARGEVHIKGGYLHGAPFFSAKAATGFYRNPERGLPATSGCVWVFDATNGFLKAILFDNGFLTEIRTGAAGAIAADVLARSTIRTVGILGSGAQARYQLEALLGVRRPTEVLVWSPTKAHADQYAVAMQAKFAFPVRAMETAREVVERADLLITTTPARQPIVEDAWVRPGTHITAMGSDMPDKRELDPALLGRAKVVADRLSQCATQGEIHHALDAGTLNLDQVYAELGEITSGQKPGRTSDREITIADQTGVGVLDAAVANLVTEKAIQAGIGRILEV